MITSTNHMYSISRPGAGAHSLPIVLDSPHSGTEYPVNSAIIAPAAALDTTRDAYVDQLWGAAAASGAPLLAARFPRAYIDPNRAPDDIDQAMLETPWPGPLAPSAACLRGMGLIRRNALPGVPMYEGKLSVNEVQQRLRRYYQPYHDALAALLDDSHQRFGQVLHINCHSMKSVGNAMNVDNGTVRPDLVVSDCLGQSADPRLSAWIAALFGKLGYKVAINTPYQGGHIVKQYGAPAQARHSVQIEIKRSLYMDEASLEQHDGFVRLRRDLETFVQALANHIHVPRAAVARHIQP
ncbi:N-formylglutamate amidohydrolase [Janthinobacterium psychrotolerans]|uniref:N-formylglutamate deformylase n=1 Tax=Janthinobacterium psychrotolerans TaxID=1747903 RepID=A0A1A7BZY3_9BURK|nr:N-formylglutamate amidohydrolase [Janthinobacterium psychrotolerans]OBV38030.1 N-formylglutamate deformylase [Janthinobacterium psychrotolerans]